MERGLKADLRITDQQFAAFGIVPEIVAMVWAIAGRRLHAASRYPRMKVFTHCYIIALRGMGIGNASATRRTLNMGQFDLSRCRELGLHVVVVQMTSTISVIGVGCFFRVSSPGGELGEILYVIAGRIAGRSYMRCGIGGAMVNKVVVRWLIRMVDVSFMAMSNRMLVVMR